MNEEQKDTSLDVESEEENLLDDMEQESTDFQEDGNENVDLEKENSTLKEELEKLKDKFLRVSAEYENYRKRTVKEKEELYGNACLDVIGQILPILDNLERANLSVSDLESLKKGIDMVVKLFYDVLGKLDVKEIDSTGEFNPNLHEAVVHIDDDTLEKNVIVEVLQKGFCRNEKVIRHSMVKVAN